MIIQTDENMQLYVNESLEHLADIESDLLAIELAGADIDEERVNKVFRAVHSIKGGAGFMGLNTIKELSHKMENVLGMIRSRELVPDSKIINVLLLATDALRRLLGDTTTSNEVDISNHIEPLAAIASGALPEEDKESVSSMVSIFFPDDRVGFEVPEYDIAQARKEGKFIYLVEFDLVHDVHKKGKTPLMLLDDMIKGGVILDCKVHLEAVGALEDETISNQVPLFIAYATVLDPEMISALVDADEKNIFELVPDMSVKPMGEEQQDDIDEPVADHVEPVEDEPSQITDRTI